MGVNRQISPFTTFWYFRRSKSILHKLYKNLDLTQVSFLEEGGFHQPHYMRTDTSHIFSSFQTQCQALETLATKRCIFIVSISTKEGDVSFHLSGSCYGPNTLMVPSQPRANTQIFVDSMDKLKYIKDLTFMQHLNMI